MAVFDRVRVLDLTNAFGVYGTKLLADLGADVVRIEPPSGDPLRAHPPFLQGIPGADRSLYFAYMNTSKRSVTLDLGCPDGRELFARLAATADVVAFAGERARFRDLSLEGMHDPHPRLIVSAITPFGLTGPFQDWTGNDLVAWATGGLAFSTGDPDRPPLVPGTPAELSYILASYLVMLGTLAALRTQRQHGKGQLVEVSLQQAVLTISGESGVSLFIDDLEPRARIGSRRPSTGPFGHFPTKDGFAAVVAVTSAHWDALAKWIHEETGNESALDADLRGFAQVRSDGLRDIANLFTEELTRLHTKQELFEEGQLRGIPITPVNDPAAVVDDPQLAHRRFWTELDVDGRAVRAPGPPARLTGLSWNARRAPRAGEHNALVYGELGLGEPDLRHLAAARVI
jgi:crotonobetainyl-CoA:carnitine CoA-transferase CaiB-like acyl-CoA transferase